MKRGIGIPSFLIEHNSLWNPLFRGFITPAPDKTHVLPIPARLGLRYKNHPMIDRATLQLYGAKEIHVKKDDFIFREGEEAVNYFQVLAGSVKMVTVSTDGQEFIQGIFKTNDSFGEPALFCGFSYPSSARAMEACQLYKLSRNNFLNLLKENFEIHLELDRILCQRLKYKSMILSEISFYDPEHRILSLLNYFKRDVPKSNTPSENKRSGDRYLVPLTRQQLADLTGMRVETVIRTVKKMENDGKLQIIGRKIAL